MPDDHLIRRGSIYIIDNCPPLAGEVYKRRPVVVISPTEENQTEETVVVMAISTTTRNPDRIHILSKAENQNATSGLHRRSWAVPPWILEVSKARLGNFVGYVAGRTLQEIVAAGKNTLRDGGGFRM